MSYLSGFNVICWSYEIVIMLYNFFLRFPFAFNQLVAANKKFPFTMRPEQQNKLRQGVG